jgi:hypothetical protein
MRVIIYIHYAMLIRYIYRNNELFIWTGALLFLYFGVGDSGAQTSLCIFHWMGISVCPGCGIGRSMHAALHGDLTRSFHYHWFGVPGVAIIAYRILSLVRPRKKNRYEQLPDGYARSATRRNGWYKRPHCKYV